MGTERDEATKRISSVSRVAQLIAEGRSQLTAQRMVEIESEGADASRARRRAQSRQGTSGFSKS